MDQSFLHTDEDQDSLFGSPPPSPARGRSPSQETFIAGEIGPILAVPSTGVDRKNVGAIALPGSHMSCAELPADLPVSSLSFPHPTSNHDSPSVTPPGTAGTPTSVHAPVVASRSSTRSIPSRASSAASNISSASASTRKRRTPKSKSVTPALPAPPITLPGPNEPTPPNLLRSQSSLLGLAGLVGSVKPAQLYTHGPQPAPVQQSRSHSPVRGSTPAHPIVLDDDQDTPHLGKHSHSQLQMPQCLDQFNPEILRSNIIRSLTKEKNILPVLESLIKLLSGKPHLPSANPQSFARPYGHGIFSAQPSLSVAPLSAPRGPTTSAISSQKRRKLKHVPAGAADWDVPFPFAAGEGPETYRDTWARDRTKQLVTQLLELVQNATKRAAIKTAKTRKTVSEGRIKVRDSPSSRSTSVETQIGQINPMQASIGETLNPQDAATGTPNNATSMDNPGHFLDSLKAPSTPAPSSNHRLSVESEGAVEAGGSVASCDYSAFEEWLSQLQQFVPLETNTPTPGSDWSIHPSVPLDLSVSSLASDVLAPMQHNALIAPHTIRDEAIDPALLAISQQAASAPQSQSPASPTPTLAPGDTAQVLDISSTPPVLIHSPRTSLSSSTEPPTPLSGAFPDVPTSTATHQDPVRDSPIPDEKEHHSRLASWAQDQMLSLSPTEPSEPCRITATQKGKGRTDVGTTSLAPSAPSRSASSAVSTPKGALDKQTILERARERRKQLVAEIERAKIEIWETSIENAVLVHFTRDGSL